MDFFEVRVIPQCPLGFPRRNHIQCGIIVCRIVPESDPQTGKATLILPRVDLSSNDFADHRDDGRHLRLINGQISRVVETGVKRNKQTLADQLIAQCDRIPGGHTSR